MTDKFGSLKFLRADSGADGDVLPNTHERGELIASVSAALGI